MVEPLISVLIEEQPIQFRLNQVQVGVGMRLGAEAVRDEVDLPQQNGLEARTPRKIEELRRKIRKSHQICSNFIKFESILTPQSFVWRSDLHPTGISRPRRSPVPKNKTETCAVLDRVQHGWHVLTPHSKAP